jgi:peptidyl-prolyl cis-trans isomerase D
VAANSISQPVKSQFGFALVKVGRIQAGTQPSYDAVATQVKHDLAIDRARKTVSDLHNKMEDERGGGSSVVDAAKKLGLTPVTIDAVDRSGHTPDGKTVTGIPVGADVVSQAFSSDVGADTDAMQVDGGYVWYDVLGITPSRDRPLDEVKDQVTARWTAEQLSGRLRSKATDMVEKLGTTGKLADEAAAAGLKVETSSAFKRNDTVPGLPAGVIEAAFRAVKDGAGQAQGNSDAEWVVFRVTGVTDPKLDLASEDAKKLKDSLQRSLTDEQVAQYVTKIETEIGTKINQDAFAIATGAATSTDTN